MSLSIINWNVEWATPRSARTPEIRRRIDLHSPEIVCLTETHTEMLTQDSYTICSGADAGYRIREERRKVMLWSREPWQQVDDVGSDLMTPGRYVCGVTQTSIGEITVMGICIPWFGSRTEARRGAERKARWEDHEQYISGLSEVLRQAPSERLIIMGDFNQKIGARSTAPARLRSALLSAIPPGMSIVTAAIGVQGRRTIDHIVLTEDMVAESLSVISNFHGDRKLSDHFGIAATLSV